MEDVSWIVLMNGRLRCNYGMSCVEKEEGRMKREVRVFKYLDFRFLPDVVSAVVQRYTPPHCITLRLLCPSCPSP